ncbi:heptaprenyl diphosphate synthase component 1 [Exiguobacterium sp. AM39-5BH]|uniref:heptaprenyl diphosphate synthase component 1 n=1 Tax=Exiguobacterium sp. AM39-5BH TaxID=2292355 RepID=UPI001F172A8A|nr:heptaprenyl diphosphate synthase component 1 [Exiguobacterium sp. AM39-5BH]
MEQMTYETVVTDLARQIEERMNHPYLTRHGIVPAVDMPLLRWMVEMIEIESNQQRQLVLATYFAHQALELHDQVKDCPNGSLERQLKVLAGDYASAQFYKFWHCFLPTTAIASVGRSNSSMGRSARWHSKRKYLSRHGWKRTSD